MAAEQKVSVLERCLVEYKKSRQYALREDIKLNRIVHPLSEQHDVFLNKRKRIITKQFNKCNLCNEEFNYQNYNRPYYCIEIWGWK